MTSSSEDISLESETLTESLSEEETLNEEKKPWEKHLDIKQDLYYSVYFDDSWYIGRIISMQELKTKTVYKMKFLQTNKDDFEWPKKEDICKIEKLYIFYGPITLQGNNPFKINRVTLNEINSKYKEIDRYFNNHP